MSSPSPSQFNMQFLPTPPQPSPAAACTSICCSCGVPMSPNAANTCARCIRSRGGVDITAGFPRHAAVVLCPSCSSYLHPPRLWLRAAPGSHELMRLLLRPVDRHVARLGGAVSLAAAELAVPTTDPIHPNRLALRLRLSGEVAFHGVAVTLEQAHLVDFAVHHRLCHACAMARARADPHYDTWPVVVQVRQRASHRRTLLHLEQRIATHGVAAADAAAHTFAVELCPVCRDDLVFVPKEARRGLGGGGGGIMLCTKVARVSDLGKNDTIFTVRTHIGHILNAGDRALGYDLYGVNVNNDDVDDSLPDAVLVKKIYEKEGSNNGGGGGRSLPRNVQNYR
uniref:60S ribosomal export protein NMD3 n=1 Tax=Leersia perrieri TaxID=77586 RepID=A0A0D9VAG6_9ORYZ